MITGFLVKKKNIARIAKRCPENITLVVKCVMLLFPKKRRKKIRGCVIFLTTHYCNYCHYCHYCHFSNYCHIYMLVGR